MRKTLPGTKQPRIPRLWHLSEYLPDARYPSIPDVNSRWRYSSASLQSTHTTLAVNDEANAETDGQTQRIRSMQVGAAAGGTVTVQLQVNGRDIFDDAERPGSGGAEKEATAIYEFPPGTPVVTAIEATSGVPTGEADTIISTELFTLLPQIPTVVLRGKDRLRVSRRRGAERANTGVDTGPPPPPPHCAPGIPAQTQGGRLGTSQALRVASAIALDQGATVQVWRHHAAVTESRDDVGGTAGGWHDPPVRAATRRVRDHPDAGQTRRGCGQTYS